MGRITRRGFVVGAAAAAAASAPASPRPEPTASKAPRRRIAGPERTAPAPDGRPPEADGRPPEPEGHPWDPDEHPGDPHEQPAEPDEHPGDPHEQPAEPAEPDLRAMEQHRVAHGLRGMWIATVGNLDWPSAPGLSAARQRRELLDLLDVAVRRKLNTVVLQIRPSADALWPSPYEPWAECLSGTQGRDPGWDPLGTAVDEAHRRGLELHAWCNPYRVAQHTDRTRLAPTHPARLNPDWVIAYGGKLYYNPGLPDVRRFVEDAMLDAVRRYPVDALHWDDYFYPYPVAGQVFDDDAAYARYGAGFQDRGSWRRHNTDLLVWEAAERVKKIRPGTRFGISPFAVWRNRNTDPLGSDTKAGIESYDDLYADTRKWVREEWIDYIVPQVYWPIGFAAADYTRVVPWWADAVDGTRVGLYIGEALYKADAAGEPVAWRDPAELSRHLTFDQAHPQVGGNIFFSARQVAADPIGAMSRVVEDHYEDPARRASVLHRRTGRKSSPSREYPEAVPGRD